MPNLVKLLLDQDAPSRNMIVCFSQTLSVQCSCLMISVLLLCLLLLPSSSVPIPSVIGSSSTGLSASPSDLPEGNADCPKTRLLRTQSDPDVAFCHVPILCVEFRAKPWERTNKTRTCQATQAFTFHLNSKKSTFHGLSPWKAGVDGQRTGEE